MKKIIILAAIALPLLVFAEEERIGYLGVIIEELSETMMKALNVDYGLVIKDVVEKSPAEKAGLEAGDVIMKIDGDKIVDYATLKKLVAAKPDKKVKILIKRDNKEQIKEATLDSQAKPKFNMQMEIPDFEEIKEMMSKGANEIKEEIEYLKEEIEKLKKELEELKKKVG